MRATFPLMRVRTKSVPQALARVTRWSLLTWLCWLVQGGVLIAVAAALIWPAPVKAGQLPGILPLSGQQSDLILSHWPSALLIKETVAHDHHLPLWNPYYGGGRPLAGDPLAALYYPFTQLVNFFPVREYYLVLLWGHLVLAGVGMLLLARRAAGLAPLPALVAAIAYMATPRLIGHLGAGHVTLVQTAAWFPWIALGCWATVRAPRRGAVPFGVCLGLMLLAGHPQLAYYGAMLAGGLAAWLLIARWHACGRRAALGALGGLAVAGIVGALLASVHLLPLMQFTAHSTRDLSVRSADKYPLMDFLRALLGVNLPSNVPHENLVEPGLAVLALAGLGVVTRWRKGLPILLGVVVVAGLAMGEASPIYLLAAKVLPEFDKFRGLSRIWFIGLVGVALLAGLGADALYQRIRQVSVPGAVMAGLVCALLVSVTLVQLDQPYNHVADARPVTTPDQLERQTALMAGVGRIYGVQRNFQQLSAVQLNTPLANAWDPLLLESFVRYMQQAGGYTYSGYQLSIPPYEIYDPGYATSRDAQPDGALLGLVNVSVVVSRTPLTDARLSPAGEVDGTYVYQNLADAGPAYLIAPDSDGSVPPPAQAFRLDGKVQILRLTAERASFAFTAPATDYFVVATPAYPGWTMQLDGHTVQPESLGGALPAISVSPGAHQVTYSYQPRSVQIGALLTTIGLLIVLGWLAARQRLLAALRLPHFHTPGRERELVQV
ncbi:MAG: YfhO family protein [Thermomicrobiales bacterium]